MDSNKSPGFEESYSGGFITEEVSVSWDLVQNSFLEPENKPSKLRKILSIFNQDKLHFKLHYHLQDDWKGDIIAEYNSKGSPEFNTLIENVEMDEYYALITGLDKSEPLQKHETLQQYVEDIKYKYSGEL